MLEARAKSKFGNPAWQVTTPPAIEPITAEDVKLFARIDGTEEDTLIESFITAARENAEAYLGRAFITQTITLKMDWWPQEKLPLPRPPLIAITAVETLDEDGTATTYDSSNYYVITEDIPGLLVLKQGVSAPYQTVRDYGGYQVRYTAGYGTLATDVPAAIREGLKLWATKMYEDRVMTTEPPQETKAMFNSYKVHRIGEIM